MPSSARSIAWASQPGRTCEQVVAAWYFAFDHVGAFAVLQHVRGPGWIEPRKTQHTVAKLIMGPRVGVCDACVALMTEIIADKESARAVSLNSQALQPAGESPRSENPTAERPAGNAPNKGQNTETLTSESPTSESPKMECSFCGKNNKEVRYLIQDKIQDDATHICDECVELCAEIVREESGEKIAG